jgi:hypothetical protein
MPQILVCTVYRERIIISSMRIFDNLNDALNYYQEIHANRFYEIHSDREPYLINRKKIKKMIADQNL